MAQRPEFQEHLRRITAKADERNRQRQSAELEALMEATEHQLIRLGTSRFFVADVTCVGGKKAFHKMHCGGAKGRLQAPRQVWRSVWLFLGRQG